MLILDNTDEKFESSTDDGVQYVSDEEIETISAQIIEQFHDVYEVLAQ